MPGTGTTRTIRVTGTGFVNTAVLADGTLYSDRPMTFANAGPFTLKAVTLVSTGANASCLFRDGAAGGTVIEEILEPTDATSKHISYDNEGGGLSFDTSVHVTLTNCRVYLHYD